MVQFARQGVRKGREERGEEKKHIFSVSQWQVLTTGKLITSLMFFFLFTTSPPLLCVSSVMAVCGNIARNIPQRDGRSGKQAYMEDTAGGVQSDQSHCFLQFNSHSGKSDCVQNI